MGAPPPQDLAEAETMRSRDSARSEHIIIAESGAQTRGVGNGPGTVPRNDGAEFVAVCIHEDTRFSHAAGREAQDGAMRLGSVSEAR